MTGSIPQRDFLFWKGRAKCKVFTSSLSPAGGAYSRALKAEKSQSPPFPVGGRRGGDYMYQLQEADKDSKCNKKACHLNKER